MKLTFIGKGRADTGRKRPPIRERMVGAAQSLEESRMSRATESATPHSASVQSDGDRVAMCPASPGQSQSTPVVPG